MTLYDFNNNKWKGDQGSDIKTSCLPILKKQYRFSAAVALCSSVLVDLFVTVFFFSFLKIVLLVTFTHIVYALQGIFTCLSES